MRIFAAVKSMVQSLFLRSVFFNEEGYLNMIDFFILNIELKTSSYVLIYYQNNC